MNHSLQESKQHTHTRVRGGGTQIFGQSKKPFEPSCEAGCSIERKEGVSGVCSICERVNYTWMGNDAPTERMVCFHSEGKDRRGWRERAREKRREGDEQ